jgi:hypothetical protein
MLDIKLDKLRGKQISGEIDIKNLKKSEIVKCNEYCKIALVMFSHFTFMYAKAKDRTPVNTYSHLDTLQLHQLVELSCTEPDESMK